MTDTQRDSQRYTGSIVNRRTHTHTHTHTHRERERERKVRYTNTQTDKQASRQTEKCASRLREGEKIK